MALFTKTILTNLGSALNGIKHTQEKVVRFARTIFSPLIEAFLVASNALKSAGEPSTSIFLTFAVLVPEEPTPPQCLPPKQIINGKCQFKATTFRPFFTTSTTTPAPPTATVPRPEGLPTPTYPKKIEPLPTLPPKIAEKTFINPPLITNTFSVSYF